MATLEDKEWQANKAHQTLERIAEVLAEESGEETLREYIDNISYAKRFKWYETCFTCVHYVHIRSYHMSQIRCEKHALQRRKGYPLDSPQHRFCEHYTPDDKIIDKLNGNIKQSSGGWLWNLFNRPIDEIIDDGEM